MRNYFILFALCIFFAGISYYLLTTLNPFDDTQIAQLVHSENIKVHEEFDQVITELMDKGLISEFLNVRNVALISSTALLSILSGFMFLHLILDRLLFRKFYEQPSVFVAFRRGIFVCLAVTSVFIYKLFAAEWYLTFLTLGLLLIVELVISRITARQLSQEELELLQQKAEAALATDASDEAKPQPKKRFQFKLPKVREWPSRFKQTVMKQVAESQELEIETQESEDEQAEDTHAEEVEMKMEEMESTETTETEITNEPDEDETTA